MSVITKKQGQLECLTAEGISVPHCFTTRLGGVSEGYLSSLNISMHRGDDPKNVEDNYRMSPLRPNFMFMRALEAVKQGDGDTASRAGSRHRHAGVR